MPRGTKLELALATAARDVAAEGKKFALVGGLAISVRAEVRFTRDVDLAVAVDDDAEAESLVHSLTIRGYTAVISVGNSSKICSLDAAATSPLAVKRLTRLCLPLSVVE